MLPTSLSPAAQRAQPRASLCVDLLCVVWMERPTIVSEFGEAGHEVAVMPLGARAGWKRDADVGFLQGRFPGTCPHHLLHNPLQLHYGRHELCTAQPFSNEQCQHGSHAKPLLTWEQMRLTAPAEGANILLPFGLSSRNNDDDVGLVAGCADCQFLEDGDVCGSCRRMWLGDSPVPAVEYLRNLGGPADLDNWRDAVGLPAPEEAAPMQEEEPEKEEEVWGAEEYGEEEWPEEDYEEEAGGKEAEWGAAEDAGGEGEESWDRGEWSQDRRGDWQWYGSGASTSHGSRRPMQLCSSPPWTSPQSSPLPLKRQ
jgi:hypothetical protein